MVIFIKMIISVHGWIGRFNGLDRWTGWMDNSWMCGSRTLQDVLGWIEISLQECFKMFKDVFFKNLP